MNTNVFKITTIALTLAIATIGCDKATETNGEIDSEINITMMEHSSGTLQLYFSTTKIYPCCNYPIDLSWKKSSNTIDISFKGVIETDFCLTALGPATATIDLGTLSNGTYQLSFFNGSVKHSGELIVSSDSYKINFVNNSNFHFTNMPLNKIPENSIWLAISYSQEEVLSSFLENLINLGATKKQYPRGFYSFDVPLYQWFYCGFMIDENDIITYYPDITNLEGVMWGGMVKQSFTFQYLGDNTSIEQLVKQYKEQMEIRIYTDKGEQFLSWMYK
jgi:hypothetical protein